MDQKLFTIHEYLNKHHEWFKLMQITRPLSPASISLCQCGAIFYYRINRTPINATLSWLHDGEVSWIRSKWEILIPYKLFESLLKQSVKLYK